MKKCRKLIALLLVFMMLASNFATGAGAVLVGGETPYVPVDDDVIPTIIVPGLFQSETKYYDENGNVALNANGEPYEMPFFLDTTEEIVVKAVEEALMPIVNLVVDQKDKEQMAANAVADVLSETLLGKQQLDENGQFINDIRATAYNASFDNLSTHDQETILDHFPFEYYLKHAGADKLYVFSYPSLDNMISTAERLCEFVQFVKRDSGYDKVNIVPISQGGSIFNAVMQMYAEEGRSLSEDFNKIVFAVPALNGSTLVGEIMVNGLIDEDYEVYRDMIPALLGEDDVLSYAINVVLRIFPNADLNNLLDTVFDVFIRDYARFSTCLWGLCPTENYPEAKAKYLSDDATKNIVTQTDWFYQAQLNSDANILQAQEDGVLVFDIVDYNVPLFHLVDSWDDLPADGIIQLDSTSMGAYGVNNNVKLPADYVPVSCGDRTHNHVDPYNLIDAGAGLLPESTFYFYNQPHESSASNDVFIKLACSILMDSNFTSVHSYPDVFPQFNDSRQVKGLMKDVAEMQEYDTTNLPKEYTEELNGAIDQVTEMLDNTVIDVIETEDAERRFYDICEVIEAYENGEIENDEPKENNAYLDFSYLLSDLIYILSQILYVFFGGAGFSDMLK